MAVQSEHSPARTLTQVYRYWSLKETTIGAAHHFYGDIALEVGVSPHGVRPNGFSRKRQSSLMRQRYVTIDAAGVGSGDAPDPGILSTTIARPWHRAIDRLHQASGSCRGLRGLQKLTVSVRCAGRRSSADERRSPRRCDRIPIPGR